MIDQRRWLTTPKEWDSHGNRVTARNVIVDAGKTISISEMIILSESNIFIISFQIVIPLLCFVSALFSGLFSGLLLFCFFLPHKMQIRPPLSLFASLFRTVIFFTIYFRSLLTHPRSSIQFSHFSDYVYDANLLLSACVSWKAFNKYHIQNNKISDPPETGPHGPPYTLENENENEKKWIKIQENSTRNKILARVLISLSG